MFYEADEHGSIGVWGEWQLSEGWEFTTRNGEAAITLKVGEKWLDQVSSDDVPYSAMIMGY